MSHGIVSLCAGTSDLTWGTIVYVKTAEDRSAVLIPYPEEARLFTTYLDFLKNDHEQIHIMVGQHQFKPRKWTFNPQRLPALWFKNPDSYPRRIE